MDGWMDEWMELDQELVVEGSSGEEITALTHRAAR
jgi:hypothetical protein